MRDFGQACLCVCLCVCVSQARIQWGQGGHAPPPEIGGPGSHIRGDPYDFGEIFRFGGLAPPPVVENWALAPPPSLNPVYEPGVSILWSVCLRIIVSAFVVICCADNSSLYPLAVRLTNSSKNTTQRTS